jgi:hypothetical protein
MLNDNMALSFLVLGGELSVSYAAEATLQVRQFILVGPVELGGLD